MKVAIIPARGGSKRIPRKNIRPFAGVPMIAHAIRAAQSAGVFDRIIVSTDDEEIAAVAEKYGAEAPFRRPPELANDHAGSDAVIVHAVRWCREQGWDVQLVCCIYATVPLLQSRYIREALDLLVASGKDFCFTAATFAAPIQRAIKLTPDGVEMFAPEYKNARSQDLTPAYHDAGQFYWGTAAAWLEGRDVFSHGAKAIVLPRHLVQDIDTEEDWTFAEMLYRLVQERAKAEK
jgi:N-acylneuraminate cytidylyltransferase